MCDGLRERERDKTAKRTERLLPTGGYALDALEGRAATLQAGCNCSDRQASEHVVGSSGIGTLGVGRGSTLKEGSSSGMEGSWYRGKDGREKGEDRVG